MAPTPIQPAKRKIREARASARATPTEGYKPGGGNLFFGGDHTTDGETTHGGDHTPDGETTRGSDPRAQGSMERTPGWPLHTHPRRQV